MLLDLGEKVLHSLDRAMEAAMRCNADLAHRVVRDDDVIDALETDLEEACLYTLALHQPVAYDLRYVVTILKVNNDLERIGDLASNIAERALSLARMPAGEPPFDLAAMHRMVKQMLADAVDAAVNVDDAVARRVCAADDEVDTAHAIAFDTVQEHLLQRRGMTEPLMLFLSISRHLERIADHAESIAEDVLYTAEGRIVRHGGLHSM